MKLRSLITLGLLLFSISSIAQKRFFGGIEGSYYQSTMSYQLDSVGYSQDEFVTKNYSFGLNAGVFLSPNFAVGIGYRRGGYEDMIKFDYSQAYRELISANHTFLAFGRHQFIRGKFGFVSDLKFSYNWTNEVKFNNRYSGDHLYKDRTFGLAYIPRFIYYPVSNLSLDLAFFQFRYFHKTRTAENFSKEVLADFDLDFEMGPTLGIHYYFQLGGE